MSLQPALRSKFQSSVCARAELQLCGLGNVSTFALWTPRSFYFIHKSFEGKSKNIQFKRGLGQGHQKQENNRFTSFVHA